MLHFLDTNVLLYSISGNPEESSKRARAIALLDEESGALSIQVLQEFYVQATRKSRPDAIPHEFAVGLIDTWRRFRIQDMTIHVLTSALRIRKANGFSYWDSAIVAAAVTLGCDRLYTVGLFAVSNARDPDWFSSAIRRAKDPHRDSDGNGAGGVLLRLFHELPSRLVSRRAQQGGSGPRHLRSGRSDNGLGAQCAAKLACRLTPAFGASLPGGLFGYGR